MIFVNRPFFNEPGYGEPTDSVDSLSYSAEVRKNVVKYAMIDVLENPPSLFAQVVKVHFGLKKRRIQQQVLAWKQYQSFGSSHEKLQRLLGKL
jgi:hypothetical protein